MARKRRRSNKTRSPAQIAASKRNLVKARAARKARSGAQIKGTPNRGVLKSIQSTAPGNYGTRTGPIPMSGTKSSYDGSGPTHVKGTGVLGRKSTRKISVPKSGKVTPTAVKKTTAKKVTTATIAKSKLTATRDITAAKKAVNYAAKVKKGQGRTHTVAQGRAAQEKADAAMVKALKSTAKYKRSLNK